MLIYKKIPLFSLEIQSQQNQSPIDIITSLVIRTPYKPIQNVDQIRRLGNVTFTNSGHNLRINAINDRSQAVITSGPMLHAKCKFHEIHFHWGEKSSFGSEHHIDGKRLD